VVHQELKRKGVTLQLLWVEYEKAHATTLNIERRPLIMQGMLERPQLLGRLRACLRTSPAVALLGPRQCGKTTLARQLASTTKSTYFDLENPVDLARLSEPMTALEQLRGLIVIDAHSGDGGQSIRA
jgi:predicted AAA+ superfamily ATPase